MNDRTINTSSAAAVAGGLALSFRSFLCQFYSCTDFDRPIRRRRASGALAFRLPFAGSERLQPSTGLVLGPTRDTLRQRR